MPKHLSDTRIRSEIANFRSVDERTLAEGSVVGLYLRIRPSGGDWIFRYSLDSRRRKMGLGTYPTVSLAEVRGKARDARAVLATGQDPIDARQTTQTERQAKAAAEANRHTVRRLFEIWHLKEASRSWKDGGAEIQRLFEKDVLPKLGIRLAESIKRVDIIEVLDEIKDRGSNVMANRALQHLRSMFRFAAMREIVIGDPTFGITRRITGGMERERERYLTEGEIRQLANKLPQSGLSAQAIAAVWALLSTLARIGELSRARRADIDLNAGLWRIPAENAKNEEEHLIHLSDFATTHFKKLLELSHSDTWLLPNIDGTSHIDTKALQKQYRDRQRTRPLAGRSLNVDCLLLSGGAWRAHDLRRTGATLMGELGVDDGTIERALNHKGAKLKRTYQRQQIMTARAAAFQLLGERLNLLARSVPD